MTSLEIVLLLALGLLGLVVLRLLGDRARLSFQVEHTKRIPATGNFRIKLPKGQWDEGFKKGAFGFAITDKSDQVVMTMTVEREE